MGLAQLVNVCIYTTESGRNGSTGLEGKSGSFPTSTHFFMKCQPSECGLEGKKREKKGKFSLRKTRTLKSNLTSLAINYMQKARFLVLVR